MNTINYKYLYSRNTSPIFTHKIKSIFSSLPNEQQMHYKSLEQNIRDISENLFDAYNSKDKEALKKYFQPYSQQPQLQYRDSIYLSEQSNKNYHLISQDKKYVYFFFSNLSNINFDININNLLEHSTEIDHTLLTEYNILNLRKPNLIWSTDEKIFINSNSDEVILFHLNNIEKSLTNINNKVIINYKLPNYRNIYQIFHKLNLHYNKEKQLPLFFTLLTLPNLNEDNYEDLTLNSNPINLKPTLDLIKNIFIYNGYTYANRINFLLQHISLPNLEQIYKLYYHTGINKLNTTLNSNKLFTLNKNTFELSLNINGLFNIQSIKDFLSIDNDLNLMLTPNNTELVDCSNNNILINENNNLSQQEKSYIKYLHIINKYSNEFIEPSSLTNSNTNLYNDEEFGLYLKEENKRPIIISKELIPNDANIKNNLIFTNKNIDRLYQDLNLSTEI